MKNKLFLVVFLLHSLSFFSQQETCTSPDDTLVDVNSITKCTIEPVKEANKKDRQIKVQVTASKRFLKKREVLKKKEIQAVVAVETAGIDNISIVEETTTDVVNEIHKTVDYKDNLSRITEKLSREELAKAKKLYYVEKIPLFNQCKKVKKKERLDCFNEEMVKHINKHFRYPSEAVRNQIQGEVWVRFIIDKDGYVTNIKTLGPDEGEILNEEARRVVSKLPHFEPGKNDGERVSVKYGFPINFSLEE